MRRNAYLQEFNFALEFADYLSYLDANITKQNKTKEKQKQFWKDFPKCAVGHSKTEVWAALKH